MIDFKSDPGKVVIPALEIFFPFNESRIDINHCIYDQLYQPTIGYSLSLKKLIVFNHISDLALTVGAGGTDVFLRFRAPAI